MKKIIPTGLMIILMTTGCTGPGGIFGEEEIIEEPFIFDLTIEDLWNDIPCHFLQKTYLLNDKLV